MHGMSLKQLGPQDTTRSRTGYSEVCAFTRMHTSIQPSELPYTLRDCMPSASCPVFIPF